MSKPAWKQFDREYRRHDGAMVIPSDRPTMYWAIDPMGCALAHEHGQWKGCRRRFSSAYLAKRALDDLLE